MNPWLIQANDLTALQVEMGADCPQATILGKPINILPGSEMRNAQLRAGGFSQMFDLGLTFVTSQLVPAAAPDVTTLVAMLPNSVATYSGVQYKVSNVHLSGNGAFISLEMDSANQNA